jgi:hypothetical protein
MKKHVIVIHFTMKIIRRTCTKPVKRKFYLLKNILAYCGYSPTSPFFLLFSEHIHCNSMATNSNSKNARSKMVASLQRSVSMGIKENESNTECILTAGFHHVTACSCLARILKLTTVYFLNFPNVFRAAVNHR